MVRVSLRTRLLLAGGVLALVAVAIFGLLRGNDALDDATQRRADARLDLAITHGGDDRLRVTL